jgi:hypothetical protein
VRRRLLIWGAAGLALAVLVLLALPVFSVLQPDYYRRYPTLGLRMDHWKTSTHSRIGCAECHIEPGVKGFVVFSARAIPDFYSQLAHGSDKTNLLQPPTRRACRKCHTRYRTVAPSGDLLIPHRAHVEVLRMQCVACHKNLVHSLNRRGFNRPEMETCLEQCHDGDKASNKCVDCHTRKQTPATHARGDWLQIHGRMSHTQDCGVCHDWTPGYCGDCHDKRPASHVGNWKEGHGPAAKQRKDGCLVCHGGKKFCDRCH